MGARGIEGLVVAEGGGGGREKDELDDGGGFDATGADDWKSAKSSSSSPPNKAVAGKGAGTDGFGGGARRGAAGGGLVGALLMIGVFERGGWYDGLAKDEVGRDGADAALDVDATGCGGGGICSACCRAAASGYNSARGISLEEGCPGEEAPGGGRKESGARAGSGCLRAISLSVVESGAGEGEGEGEGAEVMIVTDGFGGKIGVGMPPAGDSVRVGTSVANVSGEGLEVRVCGPVICGLNGLDGPKTPLPIAGTEPEGDMPLDCDVGDGLVSKSPKTSSKSGCDGWLWGAGNGGWPKLPKIEPDAMGAVVGDGNVEDEGRGGGASGGGANIGGSGSGFKTSLRALKSYPSSS